MNWLKAILAATLITALFIVIVYLAVYYAGLLLTLMAYGVLLLMFLGLVLILWKSLRNGLRSMSPRGLTPQKENNKMSTFEDLLDRLVVSFGSVPEEAEYNRSAILAAHQSELGLAVKEAYKKGYIDAGIEKLTKGEQD